MRSLHFTNRRQLFLQAAALGVAAAVPASRGWTAEEAAAKQKGTLKLLKTLKFGMVNVPGSLTDKFSAVKEAGFHGIELDAPNFNVQEVREAIEKTGLPVDGSVVSSHWGVRHTDPDATVRKKALDDLLESLRRTHAVGGNTVLLVLGHGKDGDEATIWKRSLDNLREAIPLAAELGVFIAIENVWNQFLYDHDGGSDQGAEKFVRYVDEANSPWVGMQFDIGNHWKYGDVGTWIRQLGKRIAKLDIKGFSRATDKFTKIGEDDLPWDDVRAALIEIGYTGWIAAEVSGGGPERLREIVGNIDRVLSLKA
jgi:L-ribulose-5-phosphate 3-epimerase